MVVEDEPGLVDDTVDRANVREFRLLRALDNVSEDRSLAEGDLDANPRKHQLSEVVGNRVRVGVARELRARLGDDGREGHRRLRAMMRTIASATTAFGARGMCCCSPSRPITVTSL